jgi:hypothetical protein
MFGKRHHFTLALVLLGLFLFVGCNSQGDVVDDLETLSSEEFTYVMSGGFSDVGSVDVLTEVTGYAFGDWFKKKKRSRKASSRKASNAMRKVEGTVWLSCEAKDDGVKVTYTQNGKEKSKRLRNKCSKRKEAFRSYSCNGNAYAKNDIPCQYGCTRSGCTAAPEGTYNKYGQQDPSKAAQIKDLARMKQIEERKGLEEGGLGGIQGIKGTGRQAPGTSLLPGQNPHLRGKAPARKSSFLGTLTKGCDGCTVKYKKDVGGGAQIVVVERADGSEHLLFTKNGDLGPFDSQDAGEDKGQDRMDAKQDQLPEKEEVVDYFVVKPFKTQPILDAPLDSDRDRVPDWQEERDGTDPHDATDFNRERVNDDDNDGLSNFLEKKFGLDPNNPDSDGDGVPDGEEIRKLTDPNDPKDYPGKEDEEKDEGKEATKDETDTDGDGYTDEEEDSVGTDSQDADDFPEETIEDEEESAGQCIDPVDCNCAGGKAPLQRLDGGYECEESAAAKELKGRLDEDKPVTGGTYGRVMPKQDLDRGTATGGNAVLRQCSLKQCGKGTYPVFSDDAGCSCKSYAREMTGTSGGEVIFCPNGLPDCSRGICVCR